MVIYIDLVFLINFIFDYFLLLTINVALKRYAKMLRIAVGALFGSITMISLFISMSSTILFLFKIILGLGMCIVTFGYKNIKYTLYNGIYLFMVSIILGGFLYYLKLEFSDTNKGFVFYYQGLGVNYLFLIVLAPFILYLWIKSIKYTKEIKNYYYRVKIIFDNDFIVNLTGFLDTGNKLVDPVTKKGIILVNKRVVKGKYNIRSPMYVPFNSLEHKGLLECVKVKKLYINDQEFKHYLVGFSDTDFRLDGVQCLLNYKLLEDMNDK